MIIQELVAIGGLTLRHTYSTDGKYIKQVETNAIYDEAFDVLERQFTYEELNTAIPKETEPEV